MTELVRKWISTRVSVFNLLTNYTLSYLSYFGDKEKIIFSGKGKSYMVETGGFLDSLYPLVCTSIIMLYFQKEYYVNI